ncbi:anchored repeat-type ABC transporter ATP-binding subunit [Ruania halotolerans]|uniref:anchored repeat-type ABC transporter ATP-binding subunit n=1 Tax=Ruania halotolerans TaxID=2897773 RepID=UPI001E52B1C8|nr:anchored repeat-type ABC transporter ATP-binding subunit [Ruania halotolerans]UFU05371.1 anchored repeat-type ABC transporter ATP-binding subunit [Ruania halotolerans]
MTETSTANEARPMSTAGAGTASELSVRGLAVDLGGRSVLRDVNLTAGAGELTGLIGPNGAGKTTLIRSVLGLIPVRAGEITLGDGSARAARSRVGYVPQRHEFAWDFPISVADVVLSGRVGAIGWLRRAGVADYRAANEALDRVGMSHLARRPVGELSGGQRQRVLVARALALRPALLLLDEPFTGLDIPTQELLTDLFTELSGEGRSLVMTTHDLAAAMYTFDRLYLINRTVVADGAPAELRNPDVWIRAFGFRAGSPLLDALGVA